MELNAKTVKKALDCCTSYCDKDNCPYKTHDIPIACMTMRMVDALALINSQEQRIAAQDMTISELRQRCEKAEHDASRYEQRIKKLTEELDDAKRDTIPKLRLSLERANAMGVEADKTIEKLTEENERLMRDKTALECVVSTARNQAKADTAKKTLDAVRSRATRNAYSCIISGELRETYTISGKALDEIEKELLEGV